jgi:hypothetical protein
VTLLVLDVLREPQTAGELGTPTPGRSE